jgi:hypothetical protein
MARPPKALSFLLVLSLLVPSLLGAMEQSARSALRGREAPFLWGALQEVWSSIQSLFDKEGSSLDPFGKPTPPPSGTGTTGSSPQTQEIPIDPEG